MRIEGDGPTAMTETVLAEAAIEVGHHETAKWFGMTVNIDTVIATAIAAVIVIALAFFLRAKVTSTGVPGGVQLFWEAITIQMREQIETAIGMKIAPFVLPLAVTLFVFILVSNWLSVLPVQYTELDGATTELLKPPASDINFVLGARAVRVHLLPRGGHLAPRHHRPSGASCSRVTSRSWRRSTSSRRSPSRSRCRCDSSATSSPAASWSR